MKKQKMPMTVVHPNAGGIDVGSKSHYVAIGQGSEDVKNFGVYTEDLSGLVQWLLENNVTTVAMESTGVYWQNLFVELINAGIEVVLTNGKFTKNINRKKTDVLDCQWIQKLHTLGLLPSSFLPDHITERLRTLCRHRSNMIDQKSRYDSYYAEVPEVAQLPIGCCCQRCHRSYWDEDHRSHMSGRS